MNLLAASKKSNLKRDPRIPTARTLDFRLDVVWCLTWRDRGGDPNSELEQKEPPGGGHSTTYYSRSLLAADQHQMRASDQQPKGCLAMRFECLADFPATGPYSLYWTRFASVMLSMRSDQYSSYVQACKIVYASSCTLASSANTVTVLELISYL